MGIGYYKKSYGVESMALLFYINTKIFLINYFDHFKRNTDD